MLKGAGDKENQWLDLFRRAGSRLDVMGPTMKHWKRCEDELKLAAARECNVSSKTAVIVLMSVGCGYLGEDIDPRQRQRVDKLLF